MGSGFRAVVFQPARFSFSFPFSLSWGRVALATAPRWSCPTSARGNDAGGNDAGGNDAGGIEKDAQADGDVDGDGDGDGDADADVDGDADVEIDAGADGDTEEDADVGDADAESDASVDADADADGGADADVDADADNDTDPMLARIEVTPDEASIVERRPVQLSAKGYGENDEEIDVDVTWSSSDETLATVDDEGLVTTLRPGTVTITATAFGTSDEATITITESTAARITFEADTINVPLDGEVQLHAIVEDAEGYELLGRAVSFESDDESVVTVTADGIATGIKEGEATIKAKLGALEASLDVRVVSGFAELVASARNTCALTAGGSVWCWGDDTYGQVGVGTNGATPYETPQRVDTVVSFEAVRLGRWFTCALSKEKEVWCWGANDDAVLGVAFASLWYATTPRLVPDRPYEKLSTFGYGACGLDAGGFAYCWGSGSIYYELGNSSVTTDQINPVAVSAPEGESSAIPFVELRHGDYFTCGLATTGRLYCWGRNGNEYRLGDGTTTHRARSVRPLGADHACALDHEGRAYCWGSNAAHQLGRSTSDDPADIGEVEGGLRFTRLASGDNHVCGLATNGKAHCWGENKYGQLGTGDLVDKPRPTPVAGP